MEERSRTKFAVLIALILVAAVVYSFTVNLFGNTPSVSLANVDSPSGPGGTEDPDPEGMAVQVEVTPQTVQDIIGKTLSRYRSYSRTVQVDYLRGGEVIGSLSAAVTVDDGWTRVDLTSQSGVEHTIVGEDVRYRWYHNDTEYAQIPAGESSGDLAQHLPTYEDVLALDPKEITAATYESRGGVACIYVEVAEDELGYLERYWVSVESGLLVSAETVKGDEVVYRMTAYQVDSPLVNAGSSFTLPDGTVLHEVEG